MLVHLSLSFAVWLVSFFMTIFHPKPPIVPVFYPYFLLLFPLSFPLFVCVLTLSFPLFVCVLTQSFPHCLPVLTLSFPRRRESSPHKSIIYLHATHTYSHSHSDCTLVTSQFVSTQKFIRHIHLITYWFPKALPNIDRREHGCSLGATAEEPPWHGSFSAVARQQNGTILASNIEMD